MQVKCCKIWAGYIKGFCGVCAVSDNKMWIYKEQYIL